MHLSTGTSCPGRDALGGGRDFSNLDRFRWVVAVVVMVEGSGVTERGQRPRHEAAGTRGWLLRQDRPASELVKVDTEASELVKVDTEASELVKVDTEAELEHGGLLKGRGTGMWRWSRGSFPRGFEEGRASSSAPRSQKLTNFYEKPRMSTLESSINPAHGDPHGRSKVAD